MDTNADCCPICGAEGNASSLGDCWEVYCRGGDCGHCFIDDAFFRQLNELSGEILRFRRMQAGVSLELGHGRTPDDPISLQHAGP